MYKMKLNILLRIDPLLRDDCVNISRCYVMPACDNREGVAIRDAYSRCYVASAAYACAVTSHNNRRGDAGRVLCGPTPRLYDSTERVLFSE
jgi:hypothetical protein